MSTESTFRDNQLNDFLDKGVRQNVVTSIFDYTDDVTSVDENRLRAKQHREGVNTRSKKALTTYSTIKVMKHNLADTLDVSAMEGMRRFADDNQDHYL